MEVDMDYALDSLRRLPELPIELFELSGKLGYSDIAPVITVKPNRSPLPDARPEVAPHIPTKPSRSIRTYSTWVIYPHVVCYPWKEPEATASIKMENNEVGLRANALDMETLSRSRRYYKLSSLHGRPLETPWGCVVHYGPYLATVTESESCFFDDPATWTLYAWNLDIELTWRGRWEDIPSFPNLVVVMGALSNPTQSPPQCCPGFNWCSTSMSCIPSQMDCMDNIPV
jgi:hypothetical protein